MTDDELKAFYQKLKKNYQILKEREAKYASQAPLALLNQIDDYDTALNLIKDTMIGDLTIEELQEELKSLILEIDSPAPAQQPQYPPPPEPTKPPALGEFVGRQTELTYFTDKLMTDHLAIIGGMAGIGKTALAIALADIWQVRGLEVNTDEEQTSDPLDLEAIETKHSQIQNKVFWYSFHEDEGLMPVIWALAGFLAWHKQEELWHMLQGTQLNGGQPPPPTALFDHAFKLLQGQGYLLCFDDVHFVHEDPLLAQFFDRLADPLQAGDVSLILTSWQLPNYFHSHQFEPLAGLSETDIAEIVASRDLELEKPLIELLYKHTEGNATLLMLAINVLKQADNPEKVLENLTQENNIERFLIKEVDDRLAEDDRDILVAVAVFLGYAAKRDAIETVSDRRRLKRFIHALSDRYLLTTAHDPDHEELYNSHAVIRAFYYDVPSRRELKKMHEIAAEYYQEDEPDPFRAALHYERAGDYQEAADLATREVPAKISQGLSSPLRHLLERLLTNDLPPETQVLIYIAHGQVCAFLSDNQPARESYQLAQLHLSLLPDISHKSELTARICLGVGQLLLREAPPEALSWLEQGIATLTDSPEPIIDPQLTPGMYIQAGQAQFSMGNYAAALEHLKTGLDMLPADPSPWRARGMMTMANVVDIQGDPKRAIELNEEALRIAEQFYDYFGLLVGYGNLGITKMFAGDWTGAITDYDRALALAEQLGNVPEQAKIKNTLGMLHTWQGDLDLALERLTHSLQLIRERSLNTSLTYVLNNLAALHLALENWDTVETFLEESEAIALELEIKYQLPEIYYFRTQLYLAKGQLDLARESIDRALTLSRELQSNREEGVSLRLHGELLLAEGQPESAVEAFEQSLALLKEVDPYEAARTQVAWGQHLLTGPDVDTGEQHLQAAQATFERLGAKRDLAHLESARE